MKKYIPQKRNRISGFSLVELAISLLIMGIFLSAGLSLLSLKMDVAQVDKTQKNQEIIKQALINYLGKNKRLPCPTTVANGGMAAPFPDAAGACASHIGIVPYFEIGIDKVAVLDGWENYYTYVVTPPAVSPISPSAPLTTAWLLSYNSSAAVPPKTNNKALAFWAATSTGGVIAMPTTDTTPPLPNPIASPANANGATAVLISHGKNGYGAFNIKGAQNAAPPAGNIDELQNTNPFIVATQPKVVMRDSSEVATGGGPFDDKVMILSAYDLVSPLITNGTFPTNTMAALAQANNIVLGMMSKSGGTYTLPTDAAVLAALPQNLINLGVVYTRTELTITIGSSGSTPAYSLMAGDGTTKTVSISELKGILLVGAGF